MGATSVNTPFEHLRAALDGELRVSFDALTERFSSSPLASSDPDDFLVFLRDGDHIDEALYGELISIDIDIAPEGAPELEQLPGWEGQGGAGRGRRYERLGRLGEGAMGEVFVARERSLRRKVALKTILPETARDPDSLGRFLNEAQITAQLIHPGVVPVYGLEVGADGSLGYAMAIVKGRSLAALLEERRAALMASPDAFDESSAMAHHLDIFLKVCDTLAFAHAKGVLHRDIKPDNIMVGEHGQVYVMDWGLAKIHGASGTLDLGGFVTEDGEHIEGKARHTRAGVVLGTPVYLSPEQALSENRDLDARSDLYTLGLLLQHILTLIPPREGANVFDIVDMAQRGTRLPVQHLTGHPVSAELVEVLDTATAFDREQRYASVADFASAIRVSLRANTEERTPSGAGGGAPSWLGWALAGAFALAWVLTLVLRG